MNHIENIIICRRANSYNQPRSCLFCEVIIFLVLRNCHHSLCCYIKTWHFLGRDTLYSSSSILMARGKLWLNTATLSGEWSNNLSSHCIIGRLVALKKFHSVKSCSLLFWDQKWYQSQPWEAFLPKRYH